MNTTDDPFANLAFEESWRPSEELDYSAHRIAGEYGCPSNFGCDSEDERLLSSGIKLDLRRVSNAHERWKVGVGTIYEGGPVIYIAYEFWATLFFCRPEFDALDEVNFARGKLLVEEQWVTDEHTRDIEMGGIPYLEHSDDSVAVRIGSPTEEGLVVPDEIVEEYLVFLNAYFEETFNGESAEFSPEAAERFFKADINLQEFDPILRPTIESGLVLAKKSWDDYMAND